jgi:hypothetical protein
MSYPVYMVPAGDVLPVFFSSYGKTNGESITLTGLAVTDIEIYKDGSVTQRASDAGYVLLDTDGIDFDSLTGIHGFSIDTGDNTDASFYTVGAWFHVVVSAVTIDSQTVNFIAAAFRLMPAESVAGKPKVDADAVAGSATASTNLALAFNDTAGAVPWSGIVDQGTAQSATGTTLVLRAAAAFADDELIGATILITGGTTGVGQRKVITDYVGATDTATVSTWTVTPTGTITYKIFASAAGEGVAQTGDAYAIVNSGTHGNSALKTLIDTVGTVVDAVKAKTDNLPSDPADASVVAGLIAGVDAKVDIIDTNVDDVETLLALTDTDVAAILALLDDARGEPAQGAPPVNPDLATKIDWLYKVFRNKLTQTATTMSIYNDAGNVVDHKSTVSDDATTYTRGEIVSGP